jgi:hypothetical protein
MFLWRVDVAMTRRSDKPMLNVQVNQLICVEKFDDFPQLGRFTLRDEGMSLAPLSLSLEGWFGVFGASPRSG